MRRGRKKHVTKLNHAKLPNCLLESSIRAQEGVRVGSLLLQSTALTSHFQATSKPLPNKARGDYSPRMLSGNKTRSNDHGITLADHNRARAPVVNIQQSKHSGHAVWLGLAEPLVP
jgi:hypothetical protein